MLEFLATALAVIMVPSVPLDTVKEQQYLIEEQAIVQSYQDNASTYSGNVTIKTPNGTNVIAQRTVENIDATSEYVEWVLNFFNDYETKNGNRVSLKPKMRADGPTTLYNSFSYAWYRYWTDYPEFCQFTDINPFVSDKSFIEVETPQVDDIILYGNYTYENGVEIFKYTHTGIVKEVLNVAPNGVCGNANTVLVWSKWWQYGVMEHTGDMCPFVDKYRLADEPAYAVKYYRRHTSHSYTTKVEGSIHTYACKCGDTVEKHSYTKRYVNNGLNHTAYCECGEGKTSFHSYWNRYEKYNMTQHIAYCACGASTKESHNFIVDRFGFKYCSYCKQDDIKEETIHRLNSLPLDDLFDLKDVLLNDDEKIED